MSVNVLLLLYYSFFSGVFSFKKSNQGNQGYSVNQKNVVQGQRPDVENRHTQQRT